MIKAIIVTIIFAALIFRMVRRGQDGMIGFQIAAGIAVGFSWGTVLFGDLKLLHSIVTWIVGFGIVYGVTELMKKLT